MPPLRVLSGQQVKAILLDNGFVLVSQRGSHMKLRREVEGLTHTAIVPDHRQVKIGTLSSIIRQSGLDRSLFE